MSQEALKNVMCEQGLRTEYRNNEKKLKIIRSFIMLFYYIHHTTTLYKFLFQIIYDATGTIIKWIMVTDGTVLSDDLIMSGEHQMLFLKTDNGGINPTVVKNCMITIKRYKYSIS